jgi:arsenical pump membrane protein
VEEIRVASRIALLAGGVAAGGAAAFGRADAAEALGQAWPPFALVAGLLLIGAAAGAEGLFAAAGSAAARLPGGGAALLAGSLALVAAVTAVLNLDTAVVFLTPVLLHLARERGLDEEPFLYGAVLMANAGSLFLPGSNLTNLIVLAHEHMSGGEFARRMLPGALASVVVTGAVLVCVYRRRLLAAGAGSERATGFRPGAGTLAVLAAAVLVLVLREPALPMLALGTAAALLSRALRPRAALAALSAPALAGVLGIVVALGTLARDWSGPASALASIGAWPTAFLGAAASVGVNNLPAAALLSAQPPPHPRALLLGLNLGPNLAVTGSLSALLWWQTARLAGARPSARRYSLLGFASAPLAIAAALLVSDFSGRASSAAPATTHAKAAARAAPDAPPGIRSPNRKSPAAIGNEFVSSDAAPALASALPRWKASCTQTKARPCAASTAGASASRVPPATANLVPTSPAA